MSSRQGRWLIRPETEREARISALSGACLSHVSGSLRLSPLLRIEGRAATAAEIDPTDPHVRYGLAGMKARLGDRRAALEDLKQAAGLGFRNPTEVEQDPAFEPLRGEPAYREALAVIQKNAAAPTPGG